MAGETFPAQYQPRGQWPGEVLDDFGHSITSAAQNVVSTVGNGLRSAGEMLQRGLDKPAESLGLRHSVFRVVDDPLKGASLAAENMVNDGIIDSVRTFWDGVTDGIDRIPDTFAPTGDGGPGAPGFRLPWGLGRRL